MKFSTHLIRRDIHCPGKPLRCTGSNRRPGYGSACGQLSRLHELLQKGNRVLLGKVDPLPNRKTLFNLSLVDVGHTLVSTDARLPNTLVHEAIGQSRLVEFQGYTNVLREQVFGNSRLDLLLTNGHHRC